MTADIIAFPISERVESLDASDQEVSAEIIAFPMPETAEAFLLNCVSVLCPEDYEDLLASLLDMDVYSGLDEDMTIIADNYRYLLKKDCIEI